MASGAEWVTDYTSLHYTHNIDNCLCNVDTVYYIRTHTKTHTLTHEQNCTDLPSRETQASHKLIHGNTKPTQML